MTYNFNLKVHTSTRTEVEVTCYETSVNPKTIKFKGTKRTMTNAQLAKAIERLLEEKLTAWSKD